MRRLTAILLLLSLSASMQAANLQASALQPASLPDAPTPHFPPDEQPAANPRWHQVELLNIDEPIAILEHGRRIPMPCRLDHVDDTLIACNLYAPSMAPRRITFPIDSVEAVYLEEQAYGPTNTALVIGTVAGAAVGGVVCHQGDAHIILICTVIGAALGLTFMVTPHSNFLPPPPHLHRRLIYRAPATPAAH